MPVSILMRGGFSGAVWADIADHFAGLDFKRDFADSLDGAVFAVE
jgi:hypothetical protein